MKKVIIWLFFVTFFTNLTLADIILPGLIGDNMVLQQSTEVRIWGEAQPNTVVKVYCSWSASVDSIRANMEGDWEIWIHTPSASFDEQMIIIENEKEKKTLRKLLIGEVWFCSGQSNMEMPLKGYPNCPIEEGNYTIAVSGQYKGRIRYATVAQKAALTPQKYPYGGEWKECIPCNAPDFGATAYYFATLLTDVLQVPVGVINCSWGGSRVEGWLPAEILKNYKDVNLSLAGNDKKLHPSLQPMIMYNGLLKPSSKYTIRGFLWYQGEANVGHPDYAIRLATMVEHWRSLWGLGELPFYEVEIAPYEYGQGDKAAFLREEQLKAKELIPNSGIISTNDVVGNDERHQIHYKNKKTVGYRLCYMALSKTYGYHVLKCESPMFDRMEVINDQAIVYFKHVENGFNRNSGIKGFEIPGDDKQFYPGDVKIDVHKNGVIISSPKVKKPKYVRYCFHDFAIGNLCNIYGFPVHPFRTDR